MFPLTRTKAISYPSQYFSLSKFGWGITFSIGSFCGSGKQKYLLGRQSGFSLRTWSPTTTHLKKVDKVLSLLEASFDSISGSSLSMKIQIMGGKITKKSWVQIPVLECQKIFVLFSFHFQILHTKVDIFFSATFWYLV